MPDAETFDAFYARTVWNVTSQMHALAEGDGAADHAIREAYARAYQQWYEISVLPDTESWVFNQAKEAYQRRRPDAALGPRQAGPGNSPAGSGVAGGGVAGGSAGGDLAGGSQDGPRTDSTWPGIYRPRAAPAAGSPADPDATMAPPAAAASRRGARSGRFFFGDRANTQTAASRPDAGQASPGQASPGPASAGPASAAQISGGSSHDAHAAGDPRAAQDQNLPQAGATQRWAPGTRPAGARRPAFLADRRKVVAGVAVLAVLVAGAVYLASGSGTKTPAAGASGAAKVTGKPKAQMLPAGRTGSRAQIPWTLIGAGWTLAETSTAKPDQDGHATGAGSDTIYLVDPEGGKYKIAALSASGASQLLAWSGDERSALLASSGAQPGYRILHVKTGHATRLPLPAGVNAIGFTRPDGKNILAVEETRAKFRLQRYNLQGIYQATLGSMPHRASQPDWSAGSCETGCGALSSPDGDNAVWGLVGNEMQLVSNAGGHARKLQVPDSGKPPSCVPLSWWNDSEVLALCAAASAPYANELWLVPTNGGQPTALTAVSGSGSGDSDIIGAWLLGNSTYVTETSSTQCPTAASGPDGLAVLSVGQGQSTSPLTLPDTTNNHADIVAGVGSRLQVLAQTACPGTSSLLWFNPSTKATQTLLTAPSGQVGVIAAVPFGNGPTAVSGG